jgi:acetylornithine/N-succinyldiaminopimelate aminotransferase
MSKTDELLKSAKKHLYGNYKPAPFVLERGNGCELFDVEGKRYLDLCAGVAVCSVGHAHPVYAARIAEQVQTLGHVSNWFYNRVNIECAERLCAIAELDRALFCNSGCEANEALLKLARYHFYSRGDKSRQRVIAFDNAFHGRTMGALSMTGTPKYREGFGEFGGVTHVPYGDIDRVRAAMGPDVCAIIAEPVQGEGGVLPATGRFLHQLRELCTESGALFFVDEVQTGLGRTGKWFAYQHYGVTPDAIAIAKGLGGGFPIGAMLTNEALAGSLPAGTHGTTYGGNPLASAAAMAVIDIVEREGLMQNALERGAQLQAGLAALVAEFPGVCEAARGVGLLRGLVLRQGFVARDLVGTLFERGVLIIGAGERVLRFAPPLVVTAAQIDEGIAATRALIAGLAVKAA